MAELDKKAKELGIDLKINLAGFKLSNPLMTASGTFAPRESSSFYDVNELGAVVTKGVSAEPWRGNDSPRIAETFGGMLNSVGLENPGVNAYIEKELSYLKQFGVAIIPNVVGHSTKEYCGVVEILGQRPEVAMLEINISCPNIKDGGISFGQNPESAAQLVKELKRITKKPLIIKLTPNVTDITEIAKAVEAEGAAAVSLINTVLGMHIDLKRRCATLANKVGGLSGPAIKPIALRMVWETANAVNIPVVGMGGISSGTDVAEFLAAGAAAVAIGTAALSDPLAVIRIKNELIDYMKENNFNTISELKHAFNL